MADRTNFHIVYDGPALQGHDMDVRDLAPALLAIGDALEQANRVVNGDRAQIQVKVKASFETGCFGVDFVLVQNFYQSSLSFLQSQPVVGTLALAGLMGVVRDASRGLIGLIRWLRGRKISKVEYLDDGKCRLVVEGESIEVEKGVIELLRDYKTRRSLERAIAKPLEKDGIDTFAARDAEGDFEIIEKSERQYYYAPDPEEEELSDHEEVLNLQVVSPAFKEGNKWRFSDGASSFYAEILDQDFLDRVDRNEEFFAKDDIFKVKLRKKQYLAADGVKTDLFVEEILDHKSAAQRVQIQQEIFRREDES